MPFRSSEFVLPGLREGRWTSTNTIKSGDLLFSSVVLLCGFNGTNGSTTILDEGPLGLALAAQGTAQISTAQSVFGGSSLSVNSGAVRLPTNAALTLSGDFTVEARVRFNNTSKHMVLGGGLSNVQLARENVSSIGAFPGSNSAAFDTTNNVWYALAWARQGTTLRIFGDGALIGTFTNSSTFNFSAGEIGRLTYNTDAFNGFIDELRVTAACRHTASYTVATAPFPRF